MATKIAYLLIAGVLTLFLLSSWAKKSTPIVTTPSFTQKMVTIGNSKLMVAVADTPEKERKGLMGITNMPEDVGMLFSFPNKDFQDFWNRNTLLSLDLIWVADGHVVGVSNLPNEPKNGTVTVRSPKPVDTVIEVNSGWAGRHSVHAGSTVSP